ncbi:unnamed protein product [Debaryomyces fabryi]|nr:unnamed protein product [Debaryomyces fabryi]
MDSLKRDNGVGRKITGTGKDRRGFRQQVLAVIVYRPRSAIRGQLDYERNVSIVSRITGIGGLKLIVLI